MSAEACGCDVEAGWVCEEHQMLLAHRRPDVALIAQTIKELRSAVALSAQHGTPVADSQLLREWAAQLERALHGAQTPDGKKEER